MEELRDTVGYCGLICGVCPGMGKCDCKTAPKPEAADCYQRNCCMAKGIAGCWECEQFPCDQGFYAPDNDWRGLCVASVGYVRDHGLDALVELVARKHGTRMDHGPYVRKRPEEALQLLQTPAQEGERREDSRPVADSKGAEVSPGWRVVDGQWSADEDGRLIGRSWQSAYLHRVEEHADDLRVTATMRVLRGIEITVWICGSPERVELDGYTLAVSTEKAKLQRKGEDVLTDPAVAIRPGKDHVLAFERRGATLRGFLDGAAEPFMEWTDPEPLRGEGHRTLGFYLWDGTIAVSNVQVEELSA